MIEQKTADILPGQGAQSSQVQKNDLNYEYFYIDRQLSSGQSQQIQNGLLTLQNFIAKIFPLNLRQNISQNRFRVNDLQKFKLQIMASVLSRLLSLFLESKIFAQRKVISRILVQYSFVMNQLTNTQEIIQIANKGIKAYDQFTRIQTANFIPSYVSLFQRDLIAFQYIVDKIRILFNSNSKKVIQDYIQRQSFLRCLGFLLKQSNILVELFIKLLQTESNYDYHASKNKVICVSSIPFSIYIGLIVDSYLTSNRVAIYFQYVLKLLKNQKVFQIQDSKIKSPYIQLISSLMLNFISRNILTLDILNFYPTLIGEILIKKPQNMVKVCQIIQKQLRNNDSLKVYLDTFDIHLKLHIQKQIKRQRHNLKDRHILRQPDSLDI